MVRGSRQWPDFLRTRLGQWLVVASALPTESIYNGMELVGDENEVYLVPDNLFQYDPSPSAHNLSSHIHRHILRSYGISTSSQDLLQNSSDLPETTHDTNQPTR